MDEKGKKRFGWFLCLSPLLLSNKGEKQRRRHMRFPAIHKPFAYKHRMTTSEWKNPSFIKSIWNIKTSWAKPDFKSAWCYQQSLISAFRGWIRLVGSVQRARETLYCGTDAGWMSCEWKRRMLKKEQLASSGVAVPLKREGDAARWQWFVFILVRIAPAFQESLYCLPLGLQMNHTHSHTSMHSGH